MLTTQKSTPQIGMFLSLADQLNQKHPLFIVAGMINWQLFEANFKVHYSTKMGAPAKPIRLMVALLMLKHLRNLSDENLVEQWSENSYYQYFSGEQYFQTKPPCAATELVAFRQRIGEAGAELILAETIRINRSPNDNDSGMVVNIDTTVQEKNITYPTDDKQYKKIIKKCLAIASKEGICLRQSYTQTIKKLGYLQRFKGTKYGAKNARKASKKIKVIAGRLVRELARKLPLASLGTYLPLLKLYQKVLSQKRGDSHKIYSLHEPNVKCYSKGKEHKKFEFGSKASFITEQGTNIIVGALNFTQTLHDSKTIPEALEQVERLIGQPVKEAYTDRGYKGVTKYKDTIIHVPKPDKNITKQQRKKHSNRAAIEPIIGHLKQHYRLCRNYLKGILGDNINVILAAVAMNLKRVMNLLLKEANHAGKLIYNVLLDIYWHFIAYNLKQTF